MSAFLSNNNDSRNNRWERVNAISGATMAVATVLTLIVTLFAASGNIPSWFVYIPASMFGVAMILLLRTPGQRLIYAWSRRQIAKAHFPTLISLCKELSNLTSLRLNDTIVYAFGRLPPTDSQLQMREYAALTEWMINNLISRLEASQRSFGELKTGVHDLYALTLSFYRTYFIDGIKRVRTLGISRIGEEEKRIIEVARESFAGYLGRFQSFCNGINESLGRKEFDYYFEKATPL